MLAHVGIDLVKRDVWGGDLEIETDSLPDGEVGKAYSADLKAGGGSKDPDAPVDEPEYVWDASGLPDGLTPSDEGELSGTPTKNGTFDVEFSVTDQQGDVVSKTISITVTGGLRVTTTSLPEGTKQVAYATKLAATNGNGILTWSLASGSLPAGLTLDPDGTISGTPLGRPASLTPLGRPASLTPLGRPAPPRLALRALPASPACEPCRAPLLSAPAGPGEPVMRAATPEREILITCSSQRTASHHPRAGRHTRRGNIRI